MRNSHKLLIAATGIAAASLVAIHASIPTIPRDNLPVVRIGPDYLYPNPLYTTGKAETLNADDLKKTYPCPKGSCTYSQAHRNVPDSVKQEVLKEYGLTSGKDVEIDHFYPMCAGANNDISNLWPQPKSSMWNGEDWGFPKKDQLEAEVCRRIKAGTLDPRVAFQKITTDWVAFYRELNIQPVLGSIGSTEDSYDE